MQVERDLKRASIDTGKETRQREKRRTKRSTERERTGTSQLTFMSSGCVSGPFVVLFGIPQQTTAGHIKHCGTKLQ